MGLAVVLSVNVSTDHVTQNPGSARAMLDSQALVAMSRARYVFTALPDHYVCVTGTLSNEPTHESTVLLNAYTNN